MRTVGLNIAARFVLAALLMCLGLFHAAGGDLWFGAAHVVAGAFYLALAVSRIR